MARRDLQRHDTMARGPWRGRARCVAAALASAIALTSYAASADPSESEKDLARAAYRDGRAKFKDGDYTAALASFKRAHAIMGVPTTGLELARTQAKLGMLLEARATALTVIREPAKSGEPDSFVAAREETKELARSLDKQLPKLRILVGGATPGAKINIALDGRQLTDGAIGSLVHVNPGKHEFIATAPEHATARQLAIAVAGRTIDVEIVLKPVRGEVGQLPVPQAPQQAASRTNALRVAGYTIGAIGLAGLGIGTALGVRAKSLADDSDGRCTEQNYCDSVGLAVRREAIATADVATAAFVIGGLALAGGAALLIVAPTRDRSPSVPGGRISLRVGAAGVSLRTNW